MLSMVSVMPNLPDSPLVNKALKYATEAHGSIKQKRDYSGEDYIVHPIRAAEILHEHGASDEEIAAELLHDVPEDVTPINPAYNIGTILIEFGPVVASIVEGLTDKHKKKDFPTWNRARRKTAKRNRLEDLKDHAHGPSIHSGKLADILANHEDTKNAPADFANTYRRESLVLAPILTAGNRQLYDRVLHALLFHP